jgi:hypothetical protein
MSNYKKNLQAIRDRTPDFADLIENDKGVNWIDEHINDDEHIIVIRTGSGPFKVSTKAEIQEKVNENEYHNDACTVIFGAGTGNFTKAVIDKMKSRHAVVLVEPVVHMLKISLELNDFSEAIKKGSLLFACTRDDIDFQLTIIEQGKNITQWIIVNEDYILKRPDEYSHLLSHSLMLITQLQSNTGTVSANGALIAKNDILNLPYVIKHRGVAELKDIFKDKPAILVSTGPSLQKNIHLLMDKDVQKRFIIIAVGQALRILLSYNIKPDFICSVDYGPVNFGHYKGLLDTKDIPLVSINRTYQPILKHWEGPKFISVSLDGIVSETLAEFLMHKGGLLQGGSVAHMNLGLAIQMGCNPIIMIGQDLAYDDNDRSHHSLTDEAGKIEIAENGGITWKVDDPRSEIQGDHAMGPVQWVNGYYGKLVRTNAGYVSFISTFERMFRNLPNTTFINATEGGALLKETEQMTLEEVIGKVFWEFEGEMVGQSPIDKSVLKPLLSEVQNGKELVSKSLKLMKQDIKDLKSIIKYSQRSLIILKYMKGKNTNRDKFIKRIKENFDIVVAARKLIDKNPLISMSVFWASKALKQNTYSDARETYKAALAKAEKNDVSYFYTKEGKAVLNIRIEANEVVMKASNKAAKDLLKDYESTLIEMEYMDKHGEVQPYESINPKPHLDDAETYFKNGNWGHNLIECQRILKNKSKLSIAENGAAEAVHAKCYADRSLSVSKAKTYYDRQGKDKIIKYNHYLELAHKSGRNQTEGKPEKRDFQKSLGYLLKAKDFDPDRPEAKWGIATTYHGVGDIEQEKGNTKEAASMQDRSIQTYKELIEEYPDNLQFKFELGLVYLNVGFGADADKMFTEIFAAGDDYDWFLKSLAELYFKAGMIEEAKISIDAYINKFPFDPKGKDLLEKIEEAILFGSAAGLAKPSAFLNKNNV